MIRNGFLATGIIGGTQKRAEIANGGPTAVALRKAYTDEHILIAEVLALRPVQPIISEFAARRLGHVARTLQLLEDGAGPDEIVEDDFTRSARDYARIVDIGDELPDGRHSESHTELWRQLISLHDQIRLALGLPPVVPAAQPSPSTSQPAEGKDMTETEDLLEELRELLSEIQAERRKIEKRQKGETCSPGAGTNPSVSSSKSPPSSSPASSAPSSSSSAPQSLASSPAQRGGEAAPPPAADSAAAAAPSAASGGRPPPPAKKANTKVATNSSASSNPQSRNYMEALAEERAAMRRQSMVSSSTSAADKENLGLAVFSRPQVPFQPLATISNILPSAMHSFDPKSSAQGRGPPLEFTKPQWAPPAQFFPFLLPQFSAAHQDPSHPKLPQNIPSQISDIAPQSFSPESGSSKLEEAEGSPPTKKPRLSPT